MVNGRGNGGFFFVWDCKACVSNVGHGGLSALELHASGQWYYCDEGGILEEGGKFSRDVEGGEE